MPNRLTENRDLLESLFVFGLWKEPKSFRSFRNKITSGEFFSSVPAQFYYNLGLNMFEKGYDEFDKVSVATTVNAIPGLATEYNKLGGFETYEDVKRGVKSENLEGLYNDITKLNCLTTLHEKGFDVLGNWAKMQKMNTEQIRRYFSFQLNDTFLAETTTTVVETLEITDEDMEDFYEGRGMGYSIAEISPLLNYELLGIHEGISLIGGSTGVGKSAFVSGVLMRSWMKSGIPCCITANEEGSSKWKSILVSMVMYDMFGNKGLSRRRLKLGKFSAAEKEMLIKVREKINSEYGKLIHFVKLYSYSADEVEIIIETMSARGVKNFVYDTLKAVESSNAKDEMVETVKQLFLTADRNGCSVMLTCQLAVYMKNKRYLDLDNLSGAKQTPETAHTALLMRELWDDEVTGAKYDIKAYNYMYHPTTGQKIIGMDGKPVKKFVEIEEGTESDYLIVFISKTRNGKKGVQILYRINLDYGIFEEVGYCSHVYFNDRGGNKK